MLTISIPHVRVRFHPQSCAALIAREHPVAEMTDSSRPLGCKPNTDCSELICKISASHPIGAQNECGAWLALPYRFLYFLGRVYDED